MKSNSFLQGRSVDAILLTVIKLMTILLGMVVTRLLSEYLSVYAYGTYSQVLLITSTASSLTILGMSDGVNYYYGIVKDSAGRDAYISTIYAIQCAVGVVTGSVIMVCSGWICSGFDNDGLKPLLWFAALLPFLQNLLSMTQILVVSVGKARVLAIRNLVVSTVRLAVVVIVVTFAQSVAVVLFATVLLDIIQLGYFFWLLAGYGIHVRVRDINMRLSKKILNYCIPMAIFLVLNTINRDCDKYIIAALTNTETLAVYTNASKVLPFNILMASYTTVLLPEITRRIAEGKKDSTVTLYRSYLEIGYVSIWILAGAAIAAAPQMMELLYSSKYLSGLPVFVIYILVDMVQFTNITLILSASGKTRTLMIIAIFSILLNVVLNVVLFYLLGDSGPALATLLVTLATGMLVMHYSAKQLNSRITDFFDVPYLLKFVCSSSVLISMLALLNEMVISRHIHYMGSLLLVAGGYVCVLTFFNLKRILDNMKTVSAQ